MSDDAVGADRTATGRSNQQPRGFGSRFQSFVGRNRRGLALTLLVLIFVLAAVWPRVVITIPAGNTGVLWLRFNGGTVIQPGLREGVHVIFPWDRIFIYNARIQEHTTEYEVISQDGLHIEVDVSFRWRVSEQTIAELHRDIGDNYQNVLLVPEIGSVTREIIAQYTAEAFYSFDRVEVQRRIYDTLVSTDSHNLIGGLNTQFGVATGMNELLRPEFSSDDPTGRSNPAGQEAGPLATTDAQAPPRISARRAVLTDDPDNFVTMVDLLITGVVLPDTVRTAIENKIRQAQIAEEYVYRVEREFLETQRKEIEALGIQLFQSIVQQGISENYLRWRGIEATRDLAASPNAKIIVVGGGENGLPLILNTATTPSDEVPLSEGQAAQLRAFSLDRLDNLQRDLDLPNIRIDAAPQDPAARRLLLGTDDQLSQTFHAPPQRSWINQALDSLRQRVLGTQSAEPPGPSFADPVAPTPPRPD